jgi:subtilase family serine protease
MLQRLFTAAARNTAGNNGHGVTIAIIDSFGNPNMASDLANFNSQMHLQHCAVSRA